MRDRAPRRAGPSACVELLYAGCAIGKGTPFGPRAAAGNRRAASASFRPGPAHRTAAPPPPPRLMAVRAAIPAAPSARRYSDSDEEGAPPLAACSSVGAAARAASGGGAALPLRGAASAPARSPAGVPGYSSVGGGGGNRPAAPLAAAPEPLVPPPAAGALIGDSQARMRQAAEWIYANGKSFKDAAKKFNVTAAGATRDARAPPSSLQPRAVALRRPRPFSSATEPSLSPPTPPLRDPQA